MTFLLNISYAQKVNGAEAADGSIFNASGMPLHQLERRRFRPSDPNYLQNRMFDPQLYLTGVDPYRAQKECANLASYPWFGLPSLAYDSTEMRQAEWRNLERVSVAARWSGTPPSGRRAIAAAAASCLDFQARLHFRPFISPSPLIQYGNSDLSTEMQWLDATVDARDRDHPDQPLYATVAIADICLAAFEPQSNPLLEALLDAVSARPVQGIYLVVEQGHESADARHCSSSRTVESLLHLVHLWSSDCQIPVITNFVGPVGLILRAAGAEGWASNWYKSQIRLRIADKNLPKGRAFPSYWSYPAATDISLDKDLDAIVTNGHLESFEDSTDASEILLAALRIGLPVSSVPEWQFTQSNVAACTEHYLLSCAAAEATLANLSSARRLREVRSWLRNANSLLPVLRAAHQDPKKPQKTRTDHIPAWLAAVESHARRHGL